MSAPTFPHGNWSTIEAGLSIRQYYKAAALTAACQRIYWHPIAQSTTQDDIRRLLVSECAILADAMLAEDRKHEEKK